MLTKNGCPNVPENTQRFYAQIGNCFITYDECVAPTAVTPEGAPGKTDRLVGSEGKKPDFGIGDSDPMLARYRERILGVFGSETLDADLPMENRRHLYKNWSL